MTVCRVRISRVIRLIIIVGLGAWGTGSSWLGGTAAGPQEQLYDNPAIGYANAGRNDPVARLQRMMDRGEAKLDYSDVDGYLSSVLRQLKVPVSSQGLVFSKTSFQLHRISPRNPRAIFFNDDTYVGWVRGGDFVEVSTVDPDLGGVFYMLEQTKTSKPRFVRNNECLQCHSAAPTHNVPGHIVRSVYPDDRGYPIAQLGSKVISHSSLISERWGGWFVTGTHGAQKHLGNQLFNESDRLEKIDGSAGSNLVSLENKVNLTGYLSRHSDIVALMVLEHQTQMHNLLTRLNYETRIALSQNAAMNEAMQRPPGEISDSTRRRINNAVDEVLRYLLFVDETRLTDAISGTSGFAKDFSRQGPRDPKGRSLRDLDLTQRLFRYPCSYLIYSDAFDALPKSALDRLYQSLWEVLTGKRPGFDRLTGADRQAILEILIATKSNLPDYYRRGKGDAGS